MLFRSERAESVAECTHERRAPCLATRAQVVTVVGQEAAVAAIGLPAVLKTTRFGYDALGRLTAVTNALGQVTRQIVKVATRASQAMPAHDHRRVGRAPFGDMQIEAMGVEVQRAG